MFALGALLLLIGIVIGFFGKVLGIHSIESFGDTIGGIGVILGVIGLAAG